MKFQLQETFTEANCTIKIFTVLNKPYLMVRLWYNNGHYTEFFQKFTSPEKWNKWIEIKLRDLSA